MRLREVVLAIAVLAAPRPARGASQTAAPAGDETEDRSHWLQQLEVEAGAAEADLRLRELDLRDGVRVKLLPYHLRAERIHLSLGRYGVRVTGHGVLTFCPCENPPLAIGFSGGWAGPPDELIVEDPTLRFFGVPVFWLPYLWLRSPRKIGLTTPDVSFRGPDGLFLGQGAHLPIAKGLETSVGLYTGGGFATTLDLATERTWTLVKLDVRRDVGAHAVPSGTGLAIDARGDLATSGAHEAAIAWDVDAIRGARGVRTTLELDALARPYDRASGVARLGPAQLGLDAIAPRLGPIDRVAFARPFVSLDSGLALGDLGGANATASFGPRWVLGRGAETIGDASLAATIASPVGLATLDAHARVDGRLARGGGPDPDVPASGDRASAIVSELGLELALPLARAIAIDRAAGGPPLLHVVEPLVRATAVAARAYGERSALAGFVGAPAFASLSDGATTALLAVTGVRTSLGAFGSGIAPGRDPWIGKLGGELVAGALTIDGKRDAAIAGELAWTSRRADSGSTNVALQGATTRALDARAPWAWLGLARARWESSRDGLGVELRGALRGDAPVLAGWALLGAEAAPRLTTATGLAAPGATLGAGTAFPIGFGLRLGGDVDVFGQDVRTLFARDTRLLQARSTLRYRHPCGCFRFALRGGHVLGRRGVDVFATLELAHVGPNEPRDF